MINALSLIDWDFNYKIAKRRADEALYQKLVVLKNYPALPNCSQISSAEQLHIFRGSLLNLLRYEAARQNEMSLFGPRERKRWRYGKDQEVEQGLWKWF